MERQCEEIDQPVSVDLQVKLKIMFLTILL